MRRHTNYQVWGIVEHYLSPWIKSLIGLIFLVSSVSKVSGRRSFDEFAAAVEVLAPVPGARRLLAPAVVALEFAVWGLLALPLPVAFRYGAWLATGLLLAFALGIAFAARRGRPRLAAASAVPRYRSAGGRPSATWCWRSRPASRHCSVRALAAPLPECC